MERGASSEEKAKRPSGIQMDTLAGLAVIYDRVIPLHI